MLRLAEGPSRQVLSSAPMASTRPCGSWRGARPPRYRRRPWLGAASCRSPRCRRNSGATLSFGWLRAATSCTIQFRAARPSMAFWSWTTITTTRVGGRAGDQRPQILGRVRNWAELPRRILGLTNVWQPWPLYGVREMGRRRWPHSDDRRCVARDAAFPGLGRRHGHRGCRRARLLPGRRQNRRMG